MLEAVKLNDCGGGESGLGSVKGIFVVEKALFRVKSWPISMNIFKNITLRKLPSWNMKAR
jgi:hypothetical protein